MHLASQSAAALGENYLFQLSARLSVRKLVAETMPAVDAEPQERAVRRALAKVEQLGFMEVLHDPGRPSFYIPHQISESSIRIPQKLWANGWVQYLDGSTLLLLVALIGFTDAAIPDVGIPRAFVQTYQAVELLPVSPRRRRECVEKLIECRLVDEIRTRRGKFLVLLDPELRTRPPRPPKELSTMTSEGHITIPIEVRRHLGLKTNDRIVFVINDEGPVQIKAPRYSTVASLRGAAGRPEKPLSWEEMRAIARDDARAGKPDTHP
jgi:bifunctional DNA-binding transcriptional regulator/antitoxin component of YhaV-PrlF toxin-antitoxin module